MVQVVVLAAQLTVWLARPTPADHRSHIMLSVVVGSNVSTMDTGHCGHWALLQSSKAPSHALVRHHILALLARALARPPICLVLPLCQTLSRTMSYLNLPKFTLHSPSTMPSRTPCSGPLIQPSIDVESQGGALPAAYAAKCSQS